eukprot:8462191-Pyramimonas_sp.AAC.4
MGQVGAVLPAGASMLPFLAQLTAAPTSGEAHVVTLYVKDKQGSHNSRLSGGAAAPGAPWRRTLWRSPEGRGGTCGGRAPAGDRAGAGAG